MKTRKLGWTELELTTVGLGTWAMGGGAWQFAWGPQDDRDSINAIHRALDLGINWIDTAPAYGCGHAEEVVGQALAGMGSKPLIASKCGRSWNEKKELVPCLKPAVVLAEIEASLKRLRVEVIDLYQMHWPQPWEDVVDAWAVIAKAVQQGKIRFAGVCNFSAAQIKFLQPIHPVASAQPPYSLLRREAEAELLPFCATQNVGVVAYSPMQKGLLTGKVTREWAEALAPDDHRRRDPNFQEPKLSANLALVETLRPIAAKSHRSVAELAIAWTLRRPEVTSAIVGARNAAQIEATAAAATFGLSADDLNVIEQALAQAH
jgi:aryl-alcohol dehydrogenase-like predicted oxidoreductase